MNKKNVFFGLFILSIVAMFFFSFSQWLKLAVDKGVSDFGIT